MVGNVEIDRHMYTPMPPTESEPATQQIIIIIIILHNFMEKLKHGLLKHRLVTRKGKELKKHCWF